MDIHALTHFKKTAELQHMTRAAEELHVAQPALSRTITQLEKELNVSLFDRVGKNIVLSQYGEILLKHTNRILQEMEDIRAELQDAREESTHTVTLSMYAASKLLPGLVISFKEQYPAIRLKIIQENINKELPNGCDLTIYASMHPSDTNSSVTLIEEEIFLALPETNPLAKEPSLHLSQVADEEFIGLQKDKSLRTITDAYCQIAGFEPTVIFESDNPDTVRGLIQAGIGISFIPAITWAGTNSFNQMLVPISFPVCRRYINLSWRENAYLSRSAILFRDFVQEYFKKLENKK